MDKLILVRSGNTAWQEDCPEGIESSGTLADESRLQGTLPLPLSQTGKDSLRQVAEFLHNYQVDRIYSSGNESAGSTAEFLAELCQAKVKTLEEMHELDCGLWQGLRIKDIKQRYSKAYRKWQMDPTSIYPPEGESVMDAYQRISRCLTSLNRKKSNKIITIVAAPFVSGIMECIITQQPPALLWKVIAQESTITVFDITSESNKDLPCGNAVHRQS